MTTSHGVLRTLKHGLSRKIAVAAAAALVTLGLCEVCMRLLRPRSDFVYGSALIYLCETWLRSSREIVFDKSLYRPDDVLGYITRPGTHRIGIRFSSPLRESTWYYTVHNDERGYRTTSANPQRYADKPQLAIFGCSLTWGTPHDNSNTFPWMLQARLPNYQVRNYAIGGFGNVHALLQLEQLLREGHTPRICLFMYSNIHLARNVAAPSRLNAFKNHKSKESFTDGTFSHPKAYLNDAGELEISMVPIQPTDAADPDVPAMIDVTKRIFDELYDICRENDILPILVDQYHDRSSLAWGDMARDVVRHCGEKGFHVIDAHHRVPAQDQCLPYDAHPNIHIHQFWADRVYAGLDSLRTATGY